MTTTTLNDNVVRAFANAGKVYGKTLTILTDAFKLALDAGEDEDTIANYQYSFYLNGVQTALKLTKERAHIVVVGSKNDDKGLSPYDRKEPSKNGAKNRTSDEQTVFDNLKSAFSNARKVAGFPMKPVKPRAARAPVTPPAGAPAGEPDMRIIGCTADALALLEEIAGEMNAVNKKFAKVIIGDSGAKVRDAIATFAKLVKEARKLEDEKDTPKILQAA